MTPKDSNLDCIPINKYAKIMLIRKGVRILPRKNSIKNADTNNKEKTIIGVKRNNPNVARIFSRNLAMVSIIYRYKFLK